MLVALLSICIAFASLQKAPPTSALRTDIEKLTQALTKRDLTALRAEISSSRIYVEIDGRRGAYLSNSQAVVVLENFMRTRIAIQTRFDLITDDGQSGSATGFLAARIDGRPVNYKLNLGFILSENKKWLMTRLSLK
jgi:hypothetical protein